MGSSTSIDLSESWAKLRRSRELLDGLKRETLAAIKDGNPCSLRADLDPETGWCPVTVAAGRSELRTAVLLGELIGNLRSALDYIVSSFIHENGAVLTRAHQFPMCTKPHDFKSNAETRWLKGISKARFKFIREVQPCYQQGDPETAALAVLNRLSNTDKHRALVTMSPFPDSHQVQVIHNGTIIEAVHPSGPLTWVRHGEMELLRVRFALPHPTQLDAQTTFDFKPWFVIPAFPPDYPAEMPIDFEALEAVYEQVRHIVDVLDPRTPDQWGDDLYSPFTK